MQGRPFQKRLSFFFIFFLFFLSPFPIVANEAFGPPSPWGSEPPSALETLEGLLVSLDNVEKRIQIKEQEYNKAIIEEYREAIHAELRILLEMQKTYRQEFESIATGMDPEETTKEALKPFRVDEELLEIIRPLIEGLKQMTSRPRELETLRKDIAFYEGKIEELQAGLEKAYAFYMEAKDPLLQEYLRGLYLSIQEREKDAQRQLQRSRFQLSQKITPKEPVLVSAQKGFVNFIKTRGRNLFLAILVFTGSFLFLRFLYWKWNERQKKGVRPPLYHRLLQLAFHSTTALISVTLALFLLYIFGDWMLLSIAFLMILGLAWSARNGLSQFWEQGKLLLNIGTLREGERVIFMDVPWRVEKIGLQGSFNNPQLEGGTLMIPLKNIVGMQSRPFSEDEPWFPSEKGDILLLEDGWTAEVLIQTPEQVVGLLEGGVRKTWSTAEFLKMGVLNLSRGNFAIRFDFALDYAHKDEIAEKIPEILKEHIQKRIDETPSAKDLTSLVVEFKGLKDSALHILVMAGFRSEAAKNYLSLERLINRACMEMAEHSGWSLPYTRLAMRKEG